MKGTVNIVELMDYLKDNGLVIVPAAELTAAVKPLQRALLRKTSATFSEVAQSQVWGRISYHRVAQLAQDWATPDEIIYVPQGKRQIKKILRCAIVRIARIRGVEIEKI